MNLSNCANVFLNVLEDLKQAFFFLPMGILAGFLISALYYGLVLRKADSRTGLRKAGILWAFGAYLYTGANIVFFSRESGSRQGVHLRLLETWGSAPSSQAYVIENILLMIPLGFLLPLLFRPCRNPGICMGIGFCLSVSIEFLQLVFQRGYCQLDDVWTNVLGTILGWCLWKLSGFSG